MSKVKIIPDLRFPEFENEGEWDKLCNPVKLTTQSGLN